MWSGARRRVVFTPRMLGWLALDVFGLSLFGAGALFCATGDALFVRLPTTLSEAAVLLVAGVVLMLVAAANLLREALPPQHEAADDGAHEDGA